MPAKQTQRPTPIQFPGLMPPPQQQQQQSAPPAPSGDRPFGGQYDYLGGVIPPSYQQLFANILNGAEFGGRFDYFSDSAKNAGHAMSSALGGASGNITIPALANLAQIIAGQGRTDPRRLGRETASIARGTQSSQDEFRGELSRLGLQRSGVGAGAIAAIGQGGENRIAERELKETMLQEERVRSDLDLFVRAILQPSLNLGAMGLGQGQFNSQQNTAQNAATTGAIGSILGALVGVF